MRFWRWLTSWDDGDPSDPSGVRFPPWFVLLVCALAFAAGMAGAK